MLNPVAYSHNGATHCVTHRRSDKDDLPYVSVTEANRSSKHKMRGGDQPDLRGAESLMADISADEVLVHTNTHTYYYNLYDNGCRFKCLRIKPSTISVPVVVCYTRCIE